MSFAGCVKSARAAFKELERTCSNIGKTAKHLRTRNRMTAQLQLLEEAYGSCRDANKKVLNVAGSDDQADAYFAEDLFSVVQDRYLDVKAGLRDQLDALEPEKEQETRESEADAGNRSTNREELRLPPIPLPRFDGDYRTWPSFRDHFLKMVNANTSLDSFQKLHYLKSHLEGEAAALLRGYQVTDANYHPAWEHLQKRYNNKRVLVNLYLKSLILEEGSKPQESARTVRSVIDRSSEAIEGLRNLDIDINTWDAILIFAIARKLPPETHQLWEQKLGSSNDIPECAELMEFLEGRFRTLEMVGSKPSTGPIQQARSSNYAHHGRLERESCVLCRSSTHGIGVCSRFLQLSQERRLETVRKNSLCINCLRLGHRVLDCGSRSSCGRCRKRHHTSLHKDVEAQVRTFTTQTSSGPSGHVNPFRLRSRPSEEPGPVGVESSSGHQVASHHARCLDTSSRVLLATAMVKVLAPNGMVLQLRALLDQGSQANFITEAATQHLHLKKSRIQASIKGLGNTENETSRSLVEFSILDKRDNFIMELEALVLRTLTDMSPKAVDSVDSWQHLKGIELADPGFLKPGSIDLLLGADTYSRIIEEGLKKGTTGGPIAQKTKLGWILSGSLGMDPEQLGETIEVKTMLVRADMDKLLERFWELEETSTVKKMTDEEELCERIYKETTRRQTDGRYVVSLPFKKDTNRTFGRSRDRAVARLLQLERKMGDSPQLRKDYAKCINEYLEMDHMEEVVDCMETQEDGKFTCNYLPHHAVFKESTTTKTRVVFDASSKTSDGESLNGKLMVGPTIQGSLVEILSRWRKFEFVFTADLHKMYRQILVEKEDSEVQRIVWRNKSSDPIKDYRLKTVTFGTASAPFLAIRTLHQLASDESERFPLASEATCKEFYVDDLLSGGSSLQEAKDKLKQLVSLMKAGRFELRKWSSNNLELLEDIPNEFVEAGPCKEMEHETIKTLGLYWNAGRDCFKYKVTQIPMPTRPTKRAIVSDVAKLFDPVGWVAPVIIRAKIMIQKLWLTGLGWDDTLPEKIVEDWNIYRDEMKFIEDIEVPRWIQTAEGREFQLHGFSDASMDAYSAVVYLRVRSAGVITTHLLAARTRVAPIKTITLPRLELCGATLLSVLLKNIVENMDLREVETFAWCDSKIVLDWIRGSPQRWNTFVSNRVSQVLTNIRANWNYVPSSQNPADCASRGITPKQLSTHTVWWAGPQWLMEDREHWPEPYSHTDIQLECRKVETACNHSQPETEGILGRYSQLNTLVRITALCYRFAYNARNRKENRRNSWLTTEELRKAHEWWVKYTQQRDFSEEIRSLRNGESVSTRSRLVSLNPFIDGNGILRVGGRLEQSGLSFSRKHPIILDHHNSLAELVIREVHRNTLHGGTQLMMACVRQRYWITNLRNTIRRQIHGCVRCCRERANVAQQLMGQLPRARVTPSKVFYNTGVDYCGPFDLKASMGRSPKMVKAYVAIFVCMATKAVHIELVSGLTAEAFVAAFRRFLGRRGFVGRIHMYSDNGTNFVGASRQLDKEIRAAMDGEAVSRMLAESQVVWHFIPPRAPNFGGLWEAAVKSAKHHMRRTLAGARLNYEEFATVLIQIEACMNSRPILPMTNDPVDLDALTPGHFLVGHALLGIPEPPLLELPENRLGRWQYLQRLNQTFWKQWSATYLHTLQQRPKWGRERTNIAKGSMVLVKEDGLPPARWLLGRVVDVHEGKDGLVRVVDVQTKGGLVTRALSKICVLPVSDD